MNVFALYFGLIFFLNPTVGIVDVLPDFVGVLLVLWGIKEISFLTEKIESTVPKLWGLFAVSIVKSVAMLFSGSFGGSTAVLLAFAFAVGEGILLLSVIGPLSGGLESLKIRYGTVFGGHDSAYGISPEERKRKRRTKEEKYDVSRFRIPLSVYTVFRLVMCFLPEATELRISKPSEVETGVAVLSEFKGLLYSMIIPVVTLFAVFAVIRTVCTFKLYGKDKMMLESFHEAFLKDKREFPTRHKRKLLKTAYIMFMIAVASSAYFFADNTDMIPKILPAVAFAVLFGYFGKNLVEKILGFGACALLAASSGLYYTFSKAYFAEYVESNAIWLEGAAELYRPLCIVSIIQAALVFALMILASVMIRRCGIAVISSMDDTQTTAEKVKKFKTQVTVFRIAAFLFCVVAALYVPLRPSFSMILTILIGMDVTVILSAYFVDLKL